MKVDSTRTRVLKVIPANPKTFAITKVESQGTHVTVPSFKRIADKSGDFWEVSVVIKAGGNPSRVMEWISILANADGDVKLSVLVYGNVIE